MAYDTLKLEKGLYTTGKSFTQALEEIDPSENYIGTELEGLDAYQRQLKRFDIKVSGTGSDSVSKFFATTDSAALFPEYIARAVRQGIDETDALENIIATTTEIDSLDYRAIESVTSTEEKSLVDVTEGGVIPETKIQTKETLTKLTKRGRMLVASYEAIKFQKLDLFTVTLRQIGAQIAKSQLEDALNTICDEHARKIVIDELTYETLVNLWADFNPYKLTTIVAGGKDIVKMLQMNEFKDSNAGCDFHGTGKPITPFGAQIVRADSMNDYGIIGLDKSCAVEKVTAGGVVTEFDKLIDRQLERATITTIAGFSKIFNDASTILEY